LQHIIKNTFQTQFTAFGFVFSRRTGGKQAENNNNTDHIKNKTIKYGKSGTGFALVKA